MSERGRAEVACSRTTQGDKDLNYVSITGIMTLVGVGRMMKLGDQALELSARALEGMTLVLPKGTMGLARTRAVARRLAARASLVNPPVA